MKARGWTLRMKTEKRRGGEIREERRVKQKTKREKRSQNKPQFGQ